MPEYLAPGVYVEEIEIGPRPIEGVSTSTAGFLGPTERGPINPTLVTGFEEYKRIFGGYLDNSYLTYEVDGFFRNGGQTCYIGRITKTGEQNDADNAQSASAPIALDQNRSILLKAIGPGKWGNNLFYKIDTSTLQDKADPKFRLTLVYFSPLNKNYTPQSPPAPVPLKSNEIAALQWPDSSEVYDNLSLDPRSSSFYKNEINGVSQLIVAYDDIPVTGTTVPQPPAPTAADNVQPFNGKGSDGKEPVSLTQEDYTGKEIHITDPFPPNEIMSKVRTGLEGFAEVDDISIVCAPDEVTIDGISDLIIDHCESLKYRFAILQTKQSAAGNIGQVQYDRDSKYAALYFPWINVFDPLTSGLKLIPPGGYMAGIYARSDSERGVHKAPANEVVRGATSLQLQLTKQDQEILNPKGVNVIRSFPGRGILLWGARTISKNQLWKYVNVRRLFNFIERSIDEGTQWLVFEPNNERLWSRVIATIRQFLIEVWHDGALMGTTPDEAFFVKCDRTTMTQNDIDNGRLIVIIGIAPVKPAEFVIFRLAQTKSGADVTET